MSPLKKTPLNLCKRILQKGEYDETYLGPKAYFFPLSWLMIWEIIPNPYAIDSLQVFF